MLKQIALLTVSSLENTRGLKSTIIGHLDKTNYKLDLTKIR